MNESIFVLIIIKLDPFLYMSYSLSNSSSSLHEQCKAA